jgi:hypothetical protein
MLRGIAKLTANSKKVAFIGTPGFCTPFAELAAYAMRKNPAEIVFISNGRLEDAKAIVPEGDGMQLGETVDFHADTAVLLGGLALTGIGIDREAVREALDRIFEYSDKRLLIGICFQSVFETAGWADALGLDYLIDTDMSVTLKE